MIEARGLGIGRGGRPLGRDFHFQVAAGEFWAVAGCNGSGKSTLLATLAGVIPALTGEVRVLGRGLRQWRRPELARHLGYLPQLRPMVFPYTVEEFVGFGRLPWRSRPEGTAVAEALRGLDLQALRARPLTALSGGEAQRACIAQLLAQTTDVLLLDEPMAHLDPLHQNLVMRRLRALATQGHAVLAVTHDLELAWRHCDRFLFLGPGGARAAASRDRQAMTAALRWAYGVDFEVDGHGPRLAPQVEIEEGCS